MIILETWATPLEVIVSDTFSFSGAERGHARERVRNIDFSSPVLVGDCFIESVVESFIWRDYVLSAEL